ncbi:MAG TPA: Gfo/Idh/MocA family oxidoreductase [Arsenicitalea sp.]|jgi:predicted dehydrogenase|nr:Gfo/Idh/MocA family oxidoreductase [Arsenicitalea sp.]
MAENGARRIRLGMVGGGTGAFIGYVHRIASRIDGDYDLVAGAFSSRPEVSMESGKNLGIAPERAYGSYMEMAAAESARPDGIEAVSIVTPNHMHFGPVKAFLEAGIHVICDKPLTSTLEDARALKSIQPKNGAKFLLTHNYTGYPLIRQARELVQSGALGKIRVVQAEYPQDWLTEAAEKTGSKQAEWRTDPKRSGAGGCIGDIGTHAYNLARFVSGLKTEAVSADLTTFVPGRQVDDNVNIMLRFEGGARGMLWASQVAVGQENGLALRVFGEKAGLEWVQAEPNKMWFTEFGKPKQLLTRGGAIDGTAASAMGVRIPAGHPEGYLEAFATLYSQFADVIRGTGAAFAPLLPSLEDGIEGMEFIAASIKSSQNDSKWTKFSEV